MTTNLKSIAGTDFDDLFEKGQGNQLLNIYAMDGQDVGQKYLNVSQGSHVSANTGFLASDSADVKTKLCGKGTNKISYTLLHSNKYNYGYVIYLTISGMPTGNSCTVTGKISYSGMDDSSESSSSFSGTHTVNKTITSNGQFQIDSTHDYGIGGWCSINRNQNVTLAYMGRSVVIAIPTKHNATVSGTL